MFVFIFIFFLIIDCFILQGQKFTSKAFKVEDGAPPTTSIKKKKILNHQTSRMNMVMKNKATTLAAEATKRPISARSSRIALLNKKKLERANAKKMLERANARSTF